MLFPSLTSPIQSYNTFYNNSRHAVKGSVKPPFARSRISRVDRHFDTRRNWRALSNDLQQLDSFDANLFLLKHKLDSVDANLNSQKRNLDSFDANLNLQKHKLDSFDANLNSKKRKLEFINIFKFASKEWNEWNVRVEFKF